jgi:hypothetical protein
MSRQKVARRSGLTGKRAILYIVVKSIKSNTCSLNIYWRQLIFLYAFEFPPSGIFFEEGRVVSDPDKALMHALCLLHAWSKKNPSRSY